MSVIREEETSECTNLCTLEGVKLRIRVHVVFFIRMLFQDDVVGNDSDSLL